MLLYYKKICAGDSEKLKLLHLEYYEQVSDFYLGLTYGGC